MIRYRGNPELLILELWLIVADHAYIHREMQNDFDVVL
jgi:hypothetical protein